MRCFQFRQEFFTEGAIASRCQPQHFAAQVGRRRHREAAARFRLLLGNFFQEFSLAFFVGFFGRIPGLTEQRTGAFRVYRPKRLGDTCLRAGAQNLIAEFISIGGQGNQQSFGQGATLFQDSFGFCFPGSLIVDSRRVLAGTRLRTAGLNGAGLSTGNAGRS